jgi:hypothetical protein
VEPPGRGREPPEGWSQEETRGAARSGDLVLPERTRPAGLRPCKSANLGDRVGSRFDLQRAIRWPDDGERFRLHS